MSRRAAIAWWAAFTFVGWNATFDREVARAGNEFTRTQIARYERGEAVTSIEQGFRPRVRDAALTASAVGAVIAAAGVLLIFVMPILRPPRAAGLPSAERR
jgi:hypothetical protein